MSKNKEKATGKKGNIASRLLDAKWVLVLVLVLALTAVIVVHCINANKNTDANWYSGTSYNSTQGVEGDFFYDTDDNKIYQKTNSGWNLVADIDSLKDNDNMEWLSGNGTPASSLGVVGDFYIDKDSYCIYEKKSDGWFLVSALVPQEPMTYYFANVLQAVEAIDNASYGNPGDGKNGATVSIVLQDGIPVMTLLSDVTLTQTVDISKDMTFDFNGKQISGSNDVYFNVTAGNVRFDGSDKNSKMVMSHNDNGTTAIKVAGGNVTVVGLDIQSSTTAVGVNGEENRCITVADGAKIDMQKVTIRMSDQTTGVPCGLFVERGAKANLVDCDIETCSPNGLNVLGAKNNGELFAKNSRFVSLSNHTANAAGNYYATTSRGMLNYGVATLKDCYAEGMHAGMTSSGIFYIDGGTYAGYSHGGIYFAGTDVTSYVKNANIIEIPLADGYIDDGVAGTNHGGMYIGATTNVNLYFDNCHFDGVYYPFVIKTNCDNTNVYVSNSTINEDRERGIRHNTTGNTLYLGVGNSFTAESGMYYSGKTVEGNEDYLFKFPIFPQF